MPTDSLLAQLFATCEKRGFGAKTAFAKALGISPCCLSDWRRAGRIPDPKRGEVQTWINIAQAQPIPAKPEPAAKPAPPAKPSAPVETLPSAKRAPPLKPSVGVDIVAVVRALGHQPTSVYVIEAGELVTRQAIVLP